MKTNILIVSKYAWKSRDSKHEEVRKILNLSPSITDVKFTVRQKDVGTPLTYIDGEGKTRIAESWFEQNISRYAKAQGFTHACFQFSEADGKKWGIASGHRATNYKDGDFFGEFWIKANETSKRTYAYGTTRNTYIVDMLHEMGHEYRLQGLTHLDVHDYDYQSKINNIEGFYKNLIVTKKSYIQSLYQRVFDLTKIKNLLISRPMLPLKDFERVSQHFLTPNRHYKSKVHNGTDFAVIVGTPIFAPLNGYISTVFRNHVSLGNACYYHFNYEGQDYTMRLLHLQTVPAIRTYLKGEIIAYSGNTGDSSGPHVHIDLWRGNKFDSNKIQTRNGVINNMIDPYKFFKEINSK